jgi:FAD dependent oxidoreductase TIGR03364
VPDLVVVGAGIVGLAHAVEAVRRGLSVTVVERDDRPVGASIRNFGHGCVTAQSGRALELGLASRERWLQLGREAGFWVGETGTVVVARAADEMAVLEEFAASRDGAVEVLDRADVPVESVGGARLPMDIRVDPREAAPAIARWLATQPGVDFRWSTSVLGVDTGGVRTSRGDVAGDRVVVCIGHDLDRLFPSVAEAGGMRRCRLQMLRVASPGGRRYDPAVLTGSSLLRYSGFASCAAAAAVRARIEADEPEVLEHGINLMFTQRPDGDLTIGDTHHYETTHDPFVDETLDELVLAQTARLLGVERLEVKQRWRGVYASAPGEFLEASPADGVRVVSVTSGIGMTTGLGLGALLED